MSASARSMLTINGGSSSTKFAVYEVGVSGLLTRGFHGHLDRIGLPDVSLTFTDPDTSPPSRCVVRAANHSAAVRFLVDWLEKQSFFGAIRAVEHRVVHGMAHTEPECITPELVADLRQISAYDPDHLLTEIELIEAFKKTWANSAPDCLLRYGVSPNDAARGPASAHSPAVRCAGYPAVRFS